MYIYYDKRLHAQRQRQHTHGLLSFFFTSIWYEQSMRILPRAAVENNNQLCIILVILCFEYRGNCSCIVCAVANDNLSISCRVYEYDDAATNSTFLRKMYGFGINGNWFELYRVINASIWCLLQFWLLLMMWDSFNDYASLDSLFDWMNGVDCFRKGNT